MSYDELIESVNDCFYRLNFFAFSHLILKADDKFSVASCVEFYFDEIVELKRKALRYFNTVSWNRAEDVANFNSYFAQYVNSYKKEYGNKDTPDFVYRFPDNVAEPLA